ncbi:cornichon [Phycomyces nitens]|nr:cornichon [Phycomyces nitens]
MSQVLLFVFASVFSITMLFLSIFYTIMFSDLECDYINPIDLCRKLNKFVVPEMAAQTFMFALFVINGSWLAAFIHLPMLIFHVNKIRNDQYHFDATEIFRTLSVHKKEYFIKIAFYVVCFFYFLYRMIVEMVAVDDSWKNNRVK